MSSKSTDRSGSPCPCGSASTYGACCGPLHDGTPAANAEALMRARYSAYVVRDAEYLLSTWHSKTRPAAMNFDRTDTTRWLGLEIKRHDVKNADSAVVEFVAIWREGGHRAQRLHEVSSFVRSNDRWCYVKGEILPN